MNFWIPRNTQSRIIDIRHSR